MSDESRDGGVVAFADMQSLIAEQDARDDSLQLIKVCTVCGREGTVGRCCGRDTWKYKEQTHE